MRHLLRHTESTSLSREVNRWHVTSLTCSPRSPTLSQCHNMDLHVRSYPRPSYTRWVKKQYTWLLIITSANVDQFTKFFLCQIPDEILYTYHNYFQPHVKCVSTLPRKTWKLGCCGCGQWRKSGWNSGDAGADPEGLMGRRVGCGEGSLPNRGRVWGGAKPLPRKKCIFTWNGVFVHSERYFCPWPRQKMLNFRLKW